MLNALSSYFLNVYIFTAWFGCCFGELMCTGVAPAVSQRLINGELILKDSTRMLKMINVKNSEEDTRMTEKEIVKIINQRYKNVLQNEIQQRKLKAEAENIQNQQIRTEQLEKLKKVK